MERPPSTSNKVVQSNRTKILWPIIALSWIFAGLPSESIAQTADKETRLPMGTHPILDPISDTGIPVDGPKTTFQGNVPPRAMKAADVGAVPAGTNLSITFHLNRHNQKGMDQMVQRMYTPGDPLFHHYLSVEERTKLFSPSKQEAMTVARYAQAQGFKVVDVASDLTTVTVAGTSDQVQSAFQINIRRFHDKQSYHGDFFAPNRDPQLPTSIAKLVRGIDGLTDANLPKPNFGTDPGTWYPYDNGLTAGFLRSVYGTLGVKLNGVPLNGKGQTAGIVAFADPNPQSLVNYILYNARGVDTYDGVDTGTGIQLGIPNIVKIGSPALNINPGEAELDINMLVALADGLSTIYVYEGQDLQTILTQVKNDNKTKVISSSYTAKEVGYSGALLDSLNTIFEEMALQGQNFFAASGDSGSYVSSGSGNNYEKSVEVPADSPYVTGVGGTTIGWDVLYNTWKSETSWNNGVDSAGGGGVSSHFNIPWYQHDYLSTNQISLASDMRGGNAMNSYRSVPDVSLNARHIYSVSNGLGGPVGGTSAAAPLWAAFTCLVNQGRKIMGEDTVGFLNPLLYSLASDPVTYYHDFHDINDHSNNATYIPTDGYQAVTGYDADTGLGSFIGFSKGNGLIKDLILAHHAWNIALKASANGIAPTPTIEVGSGTDITFTATLSGPAPIDTTVGLYGSGSDHTHYGDIAIPAGAMSGSIVVTAPYVQIQSKISIKGTFSIDNYTPIVQVKVDPLKVQSFTFQSGSIYSGNPGDSIVGTILLNGPAPKDEVLSVQLQSPTYALNFPKTITIAKGSTTGSVVVQATNGTVLAEQKAEIWVIALHTDIVNGVYKAKLAVEPAPIVTSVTISPRDPNGPTNAGKVLSGLSATGKVTLKSPALGMGVSMLVPSTYSGVHPTTFVIPAGKTTATFPIDTDQSLTDYTAQMEVETAYNTGASAKVFSLTVLGHQPFISTTTTVASTNQTPVDGTPVTITATVASGHGVPTGSVYFSVPGVNVPLDANGQASIVMPTELSLPPGTYNFNVTYAGDGVFQASSGSIKETLLAPSVVQLTASPKTAIQTQTIYYVAGVAPIKGRPMPTGSVTFVDQGAGPGNYVTLGNQSLDNSGKAFFADSSLLPYQTHLIVANYSGDANYPAGSNPTPVNITINPCTITGSLAADNNPAYIGLGVNYTATFMVPQGAASPTGVVVLVDNDNIIDKVAITPANNGVVHFSEKPQSAGSHYMQAQFIGNAPGLVGEGDLNLTVSGTLGQTTFGAKATARRIQRPRSVIVNVDLKDTGKNAAGHVTITSATLFSNTSSSSLPLVIGTFAPGDSKMMTLQFGNLPSGNKTLVISGTYNDGSNTPAPFSVTVTVKIP